MTETAILSTSAVNDTRFAWTRAISSLYGNTSEPSIVVSGAFNTGSAQVGAASNINQQFELQNKHDRHSRYAYTVDSDCGVATVAQFAINFTGELRRHILILWRDWRAGARCQQSTCASGATTNITSAGAIQADSDRRAGRRSVPVLNRDW